MKYKNATFLFISLILFASCETTQSFFTDNVPIEDTAIITPSVSVTVISFNGEKVNWAAGTWGANNFVVPSGEAELIVNISTQVWNTIYTGGKLKFTYNFLAGNKYLLVCGKIYVDEVEADIQVRNLTTNKRDVVRAKNK